METKEFKTIEEIAVNMVEKLMSDFYTRSEGIELTKEYLLKAYSLGLKDAFAADQRLR